MSVNEWLTPRDRVGFNQGPFETPSWTVVSDAGEHSSRAEDVEFASGRQRQGGQVEAEAVTVTFGNRDGRYTPYKSSSPYFPFDEGCPFQRDIEYPKGSGTWWPIWSGVLKRSSPGFEGAAAGVAKITFQQRLAKASKNVLPALVAGQLETFNPDGFWTCSDAADAVVAKDARGDEYTPLTPVVRNAGVYEFGVGDAPGFDPGGTRVLLDAVNNADSGAAMGVDLTGQTAQANLHLAFVFETAGFTTGFWSENLVARIISGFSSGIYVDLLPDGKLRATWVQTFVGVLATVTTAAALTPNVQHAINVTLTTASGTSTLALYVDGVLVGTDDFTATSITPVMIEFGGYRNLFGAPGKFSTGTFANCAWWSNVTDAAAIIDLYAKSVSDDTPTETADVWFERVCAIGGIPPDWITTKGTFERDIVLTATSGRELLAVLTELETAEVGRLSIEKDGRVCLASAGTLFTPERSITLSALDHFRFAGDGWENDTEGRVNDFRGSTIDGGEVRVLASDDAIRRQGRLTADSYDLPLTSDDHVADVGNVLVNLAQLPGLRLPQVELLASRLHAAGLFADVLALREGDKVTLTDLPEAAPYSEYVGRVERIGWAFTSAGDLRISLTLSQWVTVARWDQARWSPVGITLQSTINDTQTSIVAVTAAGDAALTNDPADIPFDIEVNGERMSVTAVSGATSPQTLTVTRGVAPTGPAAHSANSVIHGWESGVWGVGRDAAIVPSELL